MERLEFLLAELSKVEFSGNRSCLIVLNEQLNDLIYCLEAKGAEADKALVQIRACCWMLFEGKHTNTEEQLFLTFHYIKDKAKRSCASLVNTRKTGKIAA